jgi:hypothetical protein
MNKLLTTITLLCFSVAANADIYFCKASYLSVLLSEWDDGIAMDDDTNFIVDTDKGFTVITDSTSDSAPSEQYMGSCEIGYWCRLLGRKFFGILL